jgi:DNA helicase-2/ATP-dependent DNA helicase PcrA
VVGDDAQSIYSFRAATVRNILDFPGQFSPAAEIVTLDQNYRSTQPILTAANAVIDLAEERFTKNLWSERYSAQRPQLVSVRDEADQARYVVEKVLENREAGLALKSQAILFRASHHSGPLEVELTRRNIPFVKFGGLKFLEAKWRLSSRPEATLRHWLPKRRPRPFQSYSRAKIRSGRASLRA